MAAGAPVAGFPATPPEPVVWVADPPVVVPLEPVLDAASEVELAGPAPPTPGVAGSPIPVCSAICPVQPPKNTLRARHFLSMGS